MPLLNEYGYKTPSTQEDIEDDLRSLYGLHGSSVPPFRYLYLSHHLPVNKLSQPGVDPLMFAVRRVSTHPRPFLVAALSEPADPTPEAIQFMEERGGEVCTLPSILRAAPGLTAAILRDPLTRDMSLLEIMHAYSDTVRLLSNFNSTDVALRISLRAIGISDAEEYIAGFLGEKTLRAAVYAERAIASWIAAQRKPYDLIERGDWPAMNIVRDFSGRDMHADLATNQCLIPKLIRVCKMHPRVREYEFGLYRTIITRNRVVILHTNADASNLQEIADFLRIPENNRASVYIRNLLPPNYTAIRVLPSPAHAAPQFLRRAVETGKLIVGIVERMGPPKMDPLLFNHLAYLVTVLSRSADTRRLLQTIRIAFIAGERQFPEGMRMKKLYHSYVLYVKEQIETINRTFRSVTGTDEDFILTTPEDDHGSWTYHSNEQLRHDFYPFVHMMLQLSQEGLCMSVQEGAMVTAFGAPIPRPAVILISALAGFAEKARLYNLPNVRVIQNPLNPEEFVRSFIEAHHMASYIRSHPDSLLIRSIVGQMRRYYDRCADSYYPGALTALAQKMKTAPSPVSNHAVRPMHVMYP